MADRESPKHLDVQVVSTSPSGVVTLNGDTPSPVHPPVAPIGGAGPWTPVVMPQQPSVILVTVGEAKKEAQKPSSSEVFKRI